MTPSVRPEWEPHACCWLAWPRLEQEWPAGLEPIQRAVRKLIVEIAKNEQVYLLVEPDATLPDSIASVCKRVPLSYGDIWTRDTVPIRDAHGNLVCHEFNGWGQKYLFAGDDTLPQAIADYEKTNARAVPLVLEGGGLEFDGTGRLMATRSSLLNSNRNPGLSERDASEMLCNAYGVDKVLWLHGALINDHTDGHIDTLARFIAPGEVVCAKPVTKDPNHAAHRSILTGLEALLAGGSIDEIHLIDPPGPLTDTNGELMPVSHLNFYIANHAVLVPTYGVASDENVLRQLQALRIGGRDVVPIDALEILHGGGAVHCITRDWPSTTARATTHS